MLRNLTRHFRAWRIAKLLPDSHQLYYASILSYAKRLSSPFYTEYALQSNNSYTLHGHPYSLRSQEFLTLPTCHILNYGTLPTIHPLAGISSSSSSSSIPTNCAIIVKPSTIPNAGYGLFSTRNILRGEIVAVYPGILHGNTASSGKYIGENMGIFDRNDDVSMEEEEIRNETNVRKSNYVLRRGDGICVDAGDYITTNDITELKTRFSKYSLGHFANHPPKGSTPSIIEVGLNIPVEMRFIDKDKPSSLTYASQSQIQSWLHEQQSLPFIPLQRRYQIPYSWAPAPLWSHDKTISAKLFEPRDNDTEQIHSLTIHNQKYTVPTQGTIPVTIFVAIDNIKANSEIFFDYAYLPGTKNQPLPPWYNLIPPSVQWKLLAEACEEANIPLPDGYPKESLDEIDNLWSERLEVTK